MPGGFCGLYKNTRGARAEREHDMKRLERAITSMVSAMSLRPDKHGAEETQ